MTTIEFMAEVYKLVLEHLKRAGISVALLAVAVIWFVIRQDKQETKFEVSQREQKQEFAKKQNEQDAKLDVMQEWLIQCNVEREVLKKEVAIMRERWENKLSSILKRN